MASRVAVAIEKEEAIQRINAALARVAQETGLEYDPLPTQGKDADVVTKNQLVHIADAMDRLFAAPIVEAISDKPAPKSSALDIETDSKSTKGKK